jgi:VanZ family protein
MALIFLGSTDLMSGHHTSLFITPILRWLFPGISRETVEAVQTVIRKGWHFTEYGILALLVWNALVKPLDGKPASWFARWATRAWLICVLYAASDEFHQAFVPSRGSSVADVGLDAVGAASALAALWGFGRWRGFW